MKSNLASATSVIALLALEAGHVVAPVVSIATTSAAVLGVSALESAPAHATAITFSGSNITGSPQTTTATLTIYDLVDGAASSETVLLRAKNGATGGRSISAPAFSVNGLSGSAFSLLLGRNTTNSKSATFTYNAPSIGSQTSTVLYQWSAAGGGNIDGTLTVVGSGVAPVLNMGGSASAGFVLVGESAAATVTVTNTGNGNLSGAGATSNLRGTIGSASGGQFSGSGGSISLADSASTATTYVYTPTIRGASSTTVTSTFVNGGGVTNASSTVTTTLSGTGVAPVNAVSSTGGTTYVRVGNSATATVTITNIGDGNKANGGVTSTATNLTGSVSATLGTGFAAAPGNPASISLGDAASTTLGYTYTPISRGPAASTTATLSFTNGSSDGQNQAQIVSASVAAQGVGPEFQSKFGSVNTPTAVPNGATATSGPTINFGTVMSGYASTIYLTLGNITTDLNGGNDALTDLTFTAFTLSDPLHFSLGSTAPLTISKGGSVLLPITVMDTNIGALASTLTLFTDQSVALGGTGDTFTYSLTALVVEAPEVEAPEPASMVVLGAGLAFTRRRRTRVG